MWNSLHSFYTSKKFYDFKTMLMNERVNKEGELLCEHCQKPMLHRWDCIPHHTPIALTLANVNDYNISLNPDNIQLVHFSCHNSLENRFGFFKQNVYLVVGSPCSGKSTWVKEQAGKNDLILDIDSIWQMISNNEKYEKPRTLGPIVFAIRDCILEQIKMRNGRFSTAYILTTETNPLTRQRMCDSLGAEEIYIESSKEECYERLYADTERIDKEAHKKYIDKFFDEFQLSI